MIQNKMRGVVALNKRSILYPLLVHGQNSWGDVSDLSHVHGVVWRQYTHIVNGRTICSDLSSEMLFNCLEASRREARFKLLITF